MATTSTFFNNFAHSQTQNVLDDLIIECIRQYGMDCYYIPRRRDTYDNLLSEDDTSYYDTAYQIPIYLKSAEGFMNQEAFLSNFGLEIRPQAIFSIARAEFEREILSQESALIRPREGDLVYFPLNGRTFEIRFTDDKPFFYQHGKLQMYDITTELFEYSSEKFTTGIAEIDSIWTNFSINAYDYAILTPEGKALLTAEGNILVYPSMDQKQDIYDPLVDNDAIETIIDRDSANSVIDWSETNPFGEGRY